VDEVEARVDQGSVEVEDQQLDLVGIELAVELDHWFQDRGTTQQSAIRIQPASA
jgi:hypothetical protein